MKEKSLDITKRKNTEDVPGASEEKYRGLVQSIQDAIFIIRDGKILYANEGFAKVADYKVEELIGRDMEEFIAPEDLAMVMERHARRMKGEQVPGEDDFSLVKKDGITRVDVLVSVAVIHYEGGLAVMGVGKDITQRKQVEDELRASEENFRHSLEDSPLGICIATMEGETIYANRAVLEIYGYDSLEELKKTSIEDRYTPESYAEWQERKAKRSQGEFGPSEYDISIVRKGGEIRHLHVFRKEIFWNGQKQSQVIYQDITLRRQTEEKLNRTLDNLRQSIKTTIHVLNMALEARDPYTTGHQRRVSDLARAIAQEKGLSRNIVEGIRMAGSVHDIGKLSVPGEILTKPTKLTNIELFLIKEHSQAGYEMLKYVDSPWPLAEIVLQHHERMNGAGYPRNLKGDDILMAARIIAVADVVEAMSSHRPYRPSLGIEAALEEIEKNKGILYDETVVEACLRLFRKKGYRLP